MKSMPPFTCATYTPIDLETLKTANKFFITPVSLLRGSAILQKQKNDCTRKKENV